MDEFSVLEFLTSLEAMELPDQIEEVNSKILDKVVEDQEYVAVLFCESCYTQIRNRLKIWTSGLPSPSVICVWVLHL